MEKLRPEELEELVQELEEESGAEEAQSQEVEKLLRRLGRWNPKLAQRDAAEQLGRMETSSPRIVQALIKACESHSDLVSTAAAKSLRAPVHQECLQQHRDLMEAAESALRREKAERFDREKPGWREKAERFDRKKPSSGLELIATVGMGLAVMGVSTAMYGSNLPVFVAVFVTLVGAALVTWSLWCWLSPTSARNRFRTSHRQTAGTVIGLDKKEGHSEYGPDWRYYVTVLFGADDANTGTRVLALKAEVAHRIWKGTKHGDTVAIRYAPQDPRIALIQGEW